MSDVTKTQQSTSERVNEMEKRIADLEEWAVDVRDAVSNTLKVQENLQAKLSDLEGRSRRNNLRIYGMPEGCEGSNVKEFVAEFIKSELNGLQDIDLQIQRAHRALVPKPSQEAQPRSLVICFLEYRVKEMVLRAAWNKKDLRYQGRRIFFDHDYATEILQRRREYAEIKRALKAKQIRFQTPYPAKLKVFLDSGIKVYNSATEASRDLKKEGIALDLIERTGQPSRPLWQSLRWEKETSARSKRQQNRQSQIREKLRSYQHIPGSKNDNVTL
ncbi:LINE-1 type transposase domain-containing 1 [Labeo rohita]|uniref:LINE-1 type transposase domain-containing 1 n=1 Tax=Labeo rohita TaxID=84645 RepID=A0A498MYQ0_LABRO|nr:LINE-1 type transposase domain-containing 1 [Labeo rohita]